MPYVLPGPFVDHVAAHGAPDLAVACRTAPFAYFGGDDRRVSVTPEQVASLRVAAAVLAAEAGRTFARRDEAAAAWRALTTLTPVADR